MYAGASLKADSERLTVIIESAVQFYTKITAALGITTINEKCSSISVDGY